MAQHSSSTSSNILNEPVTPQDYQLKHRKSIHEYFNPELVNSASKMTNSSGEDCSQKFANSPDGKFANPQTVSGLVSEAFRKQNKFTQDSMIRINPQLGLLRQTTSSASGASAKPSSKPETVTAAKQEPVAKQLQFKGAVGKSAAGASSAALSATTILDDELMSSSEGVQSDQMTVSSPISSHIDNTTSSSSHHMIQPMAVDSSASASAKNRKPMSTTTNASNQNNARLLRKVINQDIAKNCRNLTASIQEQNNLVNAATAAGASVAAVPRRIPKGTPFKNHHHNSGEKRSGGGQESSNATAAVMQPSFRPPKSKKKKHHQRR